MSWQLPSLACNLTCSQKRSAAIKRNRIICCSCVRTEHQRGFYKTPPFLASAPSDSYTCTMPDSCLLKSTGLLHRKIANFLGLTSKTTSGGAKKMCLILILLYFLQSMTRSQRSKVTWYCYILKYIVDPCHFWNQLEKLAIFSPACEAHCTYLALQSQLLGESRTAQSPSSSSSCCSCCCSWEVLRCRMLFQGRQVTNLQVTTHPVHAGFRPQGPPVLPPELQLLPGRGDEANKQKQRSF